MVAYDLDGVLAEGPPLSQVRWGRMNGGERAARRAELVAWYRKAKPLYEPRDGAFVVITARRDDAEVRGVTLWWLAKHYAARCLRVHMLPTARTLENVVAFKAEVLADQRLTEFTEDNALVLKGIGQDPRTRHVQLHLYKNGVREVFPR